VASIQPVFDLTIQASAQATLTKDDWYDLGVITSGKQIWLGFATFISEDKSLIFELRANKATKSAGNATDTDLVSFSSVPQADSKDVDMYLDGYITTLAPVSTASTGVEKLWLRVRSGSLSTALFNYIIRYSLY
jgi:hypothetical protein